MTAVIRNRRPALKGLKVVEVTSPVTELVGTVLADAGAEVTLFKPHDLATVGGRRLFRELVSSTDVLVEAEPVGRLAELGLDYADLTRRSAVDGSRDTTPGPPAVNEQLIHLSITPLGRTSRTPVSEESRRIPVTDHTVQARGGHLVADKSSEPKPAMSVGPSIMAGHVAVVAVLTALMARSEQGSQFVDVSLLATANVGAGPATLDWLTTRRIRPGSKG